MNIGGKVQKLGVVFHKSGTERSFKDVAFFVIFGVEIFAISGEQAMHIDRQDAVFEVADGEVEVVWHQGEGYKLDATLLEELSSLLGFGREGAGFEEGSGVPADIVDLSRGLEVGDQEDKPGPISIV